MIYDYLGGTEVELWVVALKTQHLDQLWWTTICFDHSPRGEDGFAPFVAAISGRGSSQFPFLNQLPP